MVYAAYITTNLTASSHEKTEPAPYTRPASQNVLIMSRGDGTGILIDYHAVATFTNSFTFYLVAPPKEPAWRVVWLLNEDPFTNLRWKNSPNRTPWEKLRIRFADFLRSHGMLALSDHVMPRRMLHYIPSSEIKE